MLDVSNLTPRELSDIRLLIEEMRAPSSTQTARASKKVMIAYHGCCCWWCGKEFDADIHDPKDWHAAHKFPINDGSGQNKRASGGIRYVATLTRRWREFQETVHLTCGWECNKYVDIYYSGKQLWSAIDSRIDVPTLDGPMPVIQLRLF